MSRKSTIFKQILKIKAVTVVLIAVSVAAFASLGEGNSSRELRTVKLLTPKPAYNYKNFSLKSSFNYRGNKVFSMHRNEYVMMNTVVSYKKGNSTYLVPMKKKVILDKVKITPTARPRF